MTKSIGKSLKKSLTNTIQKSILNTSQHNKNLTVSKFDSSAHKPPAVMAASMQKSKNIHQNPNQQQKSHIGNSMFKSNNYSASSSVMRRSKIQSKLQKLK